jgi:protein involved in polysaccharide export with SLBB domain
VFRDPELSGDAVVDILGNLNLPLIGEFPAFGEATGA